MKKIKKYILAYTFLLSSFMTLTGCPTDKEAQQKFGYDAEYFVGMKQLKEGNEKEARNKLLKCASKGSYYCKRRSKELLCTLGSVQERNKAVLELHSQYNDSDSLLLAVQQLASADETQKIIEITKDIDFAEEYNETIRIRLESLRAKNDSKYEQEVYKWFTSKPISSIHYKFYRDFYQHPEFTDDFELNIENEGFVIIPEQFVINYRIETYNRNYLYTYNNASKILDYFKEKKLPLNQQVTSDIGKAYLYGSGSYSKNAEILKDIAIEYKDTELAFYFWFYTGRLFDKANLHFTHAKDSFEAAMNAANDELQKDNALWYLLNSSLSFSLDSIIESIGKYSREWSDPDYFDDFFDTLLISLLTAGKWDALKTIYLSIDGYASDETVGKFAYIYGRLLEEGYAKGTKDDMTAAFTRACGSGYSIYYKALAAYRLNLSQEELEKVLLKPYGKESKIPDADAEILLSGYVYFGFPEKIFPEWENLYKKGLSPDVSLYLANFLNRCSKGDDDYYHQALRIASRIISETNQDVDKECWKQIYPKNYSDLIEPLAREYNAVPSTIYALVRSESFFNPNVSSHAGAIGLAQLMESTGADIARKLKVEDYSLTDPKINLRFGVSYITELIRRCDGSFLSGFFAYNAGLTRVRRWKKNNIIDFGTKENMPIDLFLEVLPYAETREYGRKILSASVMYEWLYSNTPKEDFTKIVETFLEVTPGENNL